MNSPAKPYSQELPLDKAFCGGKLYYMLQLQLLLSLAVTNVYNVSFHKIIKVVVFFNS